MDKGWGPPHPSRLANGQGLLQPVTTCKWTKVGPPQPNHLQMDKGWTTPNPSNGQGCPNGQMLWAPQPFTTWGGLEMDKGWDPPNPSRLANGQGLGAPMTGPFGPELPPNAKLKFCSWYNVWLWLGRIWFGWLDGLPRCE